MKENLKASAFQDILSNASKFVGTVWGRPFLIQHDCVHKARFIKTWLDEFGVDELDWPHLWDEQERISQAKSSRPTSEPDLTNAGWMIPTHTHKKTHSKIFLPRKVEAIIAAKWDQSHFNIHVFRM